MERRRGRRQRRCFLDVYKRQFMMNEAAGSGVFLGMDPARYLGKMEKSRKGSIRIKSKSRSNVTVRLVWIVLILLTVLAFATFRYKQIDLAEAVQSTFHNIGTVFFQPELTYDTFGGALYQLLITFCLGALSTGIGAAAALFLSLLCAKNMANSKVDVYKRQRQPLPAEPGDRDVPRRSGERGGAENRGCDARSRNAGRV